MERRPRTPTVADKEVKHRGRIETLNETPLRITSVEIKKASTEDKPIDDASTRELSFEESSELIEKKLEDSPDTNNVNEESNKFKEHNTEGLKSTDGKYEVLETLGKGGMGEVFLAKMPDYAIEQEDGTMDERLVVIKVLRKDLKGAVIQERFDKELKALVGLSRNPFVIQVEDKITLEDGRMGIVMEYAGKSGPDDTSVISLSEQLSFPDRSADLTGLQTVEAKIGTNPSESKEIESLEEEAGETVEPLSLDEVGQMAVQLCLALQGAHELNIIHRDLKPENILLYKHTDSDELRLKLIDFGIAKAIENSIDSSSMVKLVDDQSPNTEQILSRSSLQEETNMQLTGAGMVIGTPAYMSPEQFTGSEISPQTDLYALGIVLYEALAKHHPLKTETDNSASLMMKTINKEPEPLIEAAPGTPKRLSDIVMTLLKKKPEERKALIDGEKVISLESAADVALAIKQVMVNEDPSNDFRYPYIYLGAGMAPEEK